MTVQTLDRPPTAPAKPARRVRLTGGGLLKTYSWLLIAWLILPILFVVAFAFNDPKGRFNQRWQGFTLKWFLPENLFANPALTTGLVNSVVIALVTMIVAGAIGTGIGYALGRYRFRFAGLFNLLMFTTMASPELIMGTSLNGYFVTLGLGQGYLTVIIAHVLFTIAFVATVVRSRVLTLDRSIEEAAADLGANGWTTFWRITFPILLPAVFSGMLLAFALSIDDFVVTQFTAGSTGTFPLYIWGASRVGLPPQVNVMGTLIFAVGVFFAVLPHIRAKLKKTSKQD